MVLHLNKLESHSFKDALCQVWLKLDSRSGEEDFLNFIYVFLIFHNHLPLETGWVLHLPKLESPSPKDALYQVWSKLAQLFWRRRFLNFVNVFSLFLYYLPLKKRWGPSFEQTRILITQGCIVRSLIEIGPVVL